MDGTQKLSATVSPILYQALRKEVRKHGRRAILNRRRLAEKGVESAKRDIMLMTEIAEREGIKL